ncbi:M1 family metallopeptidase [Actinoplanes sp. NPDC049265]|uniref:M1 family metallopeptidase n=1 Tax=Actinoplanes sp. NPDC049265 TaxID=3363902 RepID=UPI00371D9B77
MRRAVAVPLVLLLAAAGCTRASDPVPVRTPVPQPTFSAGTDGIGDDYFPAYGNGGYDVAGYDLNLRYDPASGKLGGTATITATATQDLSAFNLDLAGLTVSSVTVDRATARFSAARNELTVTPAVGIVRTTQFTTVVEYAGTPQAIGNDTLGEGGWQRTRDGGFALGQPESASTWFPVNDHPADKATFELAMTVPDGVAAISNGVPGGRTSSGGWSTWTWTESKPLASYLSFVAIGHYRVESATHLGKPMVIAIPESLPADGPAAKSLARTGEVADFLATQFGPYPFDAYGGVVLDDQRVSYALETQSRPVYGSVFFRAENAGVVAHELAHQWFGDSVALERWQDIWLNEGFATYAEWLWSEHEGTATAQQIFDRKYESFDWTRTPGRPGTAGLFGEAVYDRGGMTVHALRKAIGDAAFFGLLKSWPAEHADGNATTEDFVRSAEKAAGGKDLSAFFDDWLYGRTKPPLSVNQ